ncbi:MAG: GlpM family protein [Chloroflexia bacterium]|nr:GlpM family protein [Chloroflexia bacterium]
MELLLKAVLGAGVVLLIAVLAKSRVFYIAGLVPLFPTFALISHYIVGTQRTTAELKQTILFGMLSLVPYFVYLLALYLLLDRFKLLPALLGATAGWILVATLLVLLWKR